jgi:CheY-like chemotaxis protein
MEENKSLSNSEIDDAVKSLSSTKARKDKNHIVLIIDDDKWVQRVLGHYLKEWGFQHEAALDPLDGIALAVGHRPLLIILDIIMPEVHGDVLLKMLKRIEITANIPVIVMSGNLNKEILGTTFKEGAAGFISKPISQDILYQKIKDCLGPQIFKDLEAAKNTQKLQMVYTGD